MTYTKEHPKKITRPHVNGEAGLINIPLPISFRNGQPLVLDRAVSFDLESPVGWTGFIAHRKTKPAKCAFAVRRPMRGLFLITHQDKVGDRERIASGGFETEI